MHGLESVCIWGACCLGDDIQFKLSLCYLFVMLYLFMYSSFICYVFVSYITKMYIHVFIFNSLVDSFDYHKRSGLE